MTAPAAQPCLFDLNISAATLANLAASTVPILASAELAAPGTPNTQLPLASPRIELDAILTELAELAVDKAIASRMPATVEWREEITADRAALNRRAQYLRTQLTTQD